MQRKTRKSEPVADQEQIQLETEPHAIPIDSSLSFHVDLEDAPILGEKQAREAAGGFFDVPRSQGASQHVLQTIQRNTMLSLSLQEKQVWKWYPSTQECWGFPQEGK